MILLDRLKVFIISASGFYLLLTEFSCRIFKNGRPAGASFQHNSSNDQYTVVLGTQTVLRTARKSCGEFSRKCPGKPIPGETEAANSNLSNLSTVYNIDILCIM